MGSPRCYDGDTLPDAQPRRCDLAHVTARGGRSSDRRWPSEAFAPICRWRALPGFIGISTMSSSTPAANFTSTSRLAEYLRLPGTIVVDGSWYLPNLNRKARAEY